MKQNNLDPPSCLLANYCHYLARQTCHEIRISSQNRVISGSSCYPVLCKSVTSAVKQQLGLLRIHTLPGGEQRNISTPEMLQKKLGVPTDISGAKPTPTLLHLLKELSFKDTEKD